VSNPEDYLMISALQHYAYCPRQCALIHIEKVWDENLFTLRGKRVHEVVDTPGDELIEDIRVERSLPIWSHKLGITGFADVVEFSDNNVPYPVEYKSGSRKGRLADSIQLCAQALCLEEMMNCVVPVGAIFHHGSRRRREVRFDENLRSLTIQTIAGTRSLFAAAKLPHPVADKRCKDCSLIDACLPYAIHNFSTEDIGQNPFKVEPEL
jgi:CRISPR-associated exonuclease Cas4